MGARQQAESFTYRSARRIYKLSQRNSEQVLKSLLSSRDGLSAEVIEERRATFGVNEVVTDAHVPALHFLIKAFRNPFNYLLLS